MCLGYIPMIKYHAAGFIQDGRLSAITAVVSLLLKICHKLTEMLMPRIPSIFLISTVTSSGLTQFREGDREQLS